MLKLLFVLIVIIIIAFLIAVQFAKKSPISKGSIPILVNEIKLKQEEMPDLTNKTFLITGANSGLGKSSTKILVTAGATVIMACRSISKAEKAKERIIEEIEEEKKSKSKVDYSKFKEENLSIMILDLGSLKSVKTFAEEFNEKHKKLDCLMLNAGIMAPPYGETVDGIEQMMGVNHFGHFYLTQLLMPTLEASQPCSIVSVSSAGHFSSVVGGILKDLEEMNNEKIYNKANNYGQSKLANILFTKELDRRLMADGKEIYINAVHPGVVVTELARFLPLADKVYPMMTKYCPNKVLFESDLAALCQVYAALAPVILEEKVSGKYFVPLGEECEPHKHANDKVLQERLWKLTEGVLKEKGFEY